jgi:putative inorganic carbon (hco3(-)) transporter
MRDLLVFGLFFGAIPKCLFNPYYGLLLWVIVSIMNPHRLTYGAAYDFPFAQISAIVVFFGLVASKKAKWFRPDAILAAILSLALWTIVTHTQALNPSENFYKLSETLKMFLMVVVAFSIVQTREQIVGLVWTLVVSVGFYGLKGGLFTALTAGQSLVLGPPGSHIGDNNAISVALVIVMPLAYFVYLQSKNFSIRMGLVTMACFSLLAILGSHSRGALLCLVVMLLMFWTKSPKKVLSGIFLLVLALIGLSLMPEKWFDRMESIANFNQDASVLGRFNGWAFAWNLAKDNPITGGGFAIYTPQLFWRYAPIPEDLHTTHNIFFQYLGEHGFIGLALFLFTLASSLWATRETQKMTFGIERLAWAGHLCGMAQISVIVFMTAGMSVNIGYWDLIFYIMLIASVTRRIVLSELANEPKGVGVDLGAPIGRRYSRAH